MFVVFKVFFLSVSVKYNRIRFNIRLSDTILNHGAFSFLDDKYTENFCSAASNSL